MRSLGVGHSVLSPAGVEACAIHTLWLAMLAICAAAFIAVLAAVLLAVYRATHRRTDGSSLPTESSLTRYVSAAVAITVVTVIALLVASVWTGRAVASLHASSAVSIAITGHQW